MRYIFISLFFLSSLFSTDFSKEYYKIKDTRKMKQSFFIFINKLATDQNNLILADRKFVKYFYIRKDAQTNNISEYKRFKLIQKRYRLKNIDPLSKYLKHIDIIPNSLVIVQAAIESGWGKSRFAKEANNIFGQWTWGKKGLVPKQRDISSTHKIKIFDSLEDAVSGYMINLNLGWEYKGLRDEREKMRKANKSISGLKLSQTLINYSQKKELYVQLLAKIIKKNNLQRFDK